MKINKKTRNQNNSRKCFPRNSLIHHDSPSYFEMDEYFDTPLMNSWNKKESILLKHHDITSTSRCLRKTGCFNKIPMKREGSQKDCLVRLSRSIKSNKQEAADLGLSLRGHRQQSLLSTIVLEIKHNVNRTVIRNKPALTRQKNVGKTPNKDLVLQSRTEEDNKPTEQNCYSIKSAVLHKDAEPEIIGNTLTDLLQTLTSVVSYQPQRKILVREGKAQVNEMRPKLWMTRWMSSPRFGLGYQLSDDSYGGLFTDSSKLIMFSDGRNVQYQEEDGKIRRYTRRYHPELLANKVYLLNIVRTRLKREMQELDPKGMLVQKVQEDNDLSYSVPYLLAWYKLEGSTVFHFSNNMVQINLHKQGKLILCPENHTLTVIDQQWRFRTYKINLLQQFGCSWDLFYKLCYSQRVIRMLLTSKI